MLQHKSPTQCLISPFWATVETWQCKMEDVVERRPWQKICEETSRNLQLLVIKPPGRAPGEGSQAIVKSNFVTPTTLKLCLYHPTCIRGTYILVHSFKSYNIRFVREQTTLSTLNTVPQGLFCVGCTVEGDKADEREKRASRTTADKGQLHCSYITG